MTCVSVSANAVTNSRFNGYHVGAELGIINSFANVDSLTNASFGTTIQNTTVVTTVSGISTTTSTTRTRNNQALTANPGNSRHNFAAGAINIGVGAQHECE